MIKRIIMMRKLTKIALIFLILIMNITMFISLNYANTYSNNSIEIEVSPQRRSYDYGDNVGIDINITNKNRYAKLHYNIIEIYSGGGFIPINLDSNEKIIDALGTAEIEINLKDFFYNNPEDRTIDTHITFNNGYSNPNNNDKADSGISKNNSYYHKKHTYNIGGHAYELTEAEYDEYERYRNEKVVGEKLGKSPVEKIEQEKLENVKSQINATLLIVLIVLIIVFVLIIFIWFIIKSKSRSGYHGLSSILVLILLTSIILKNKVFAADIYQENVKYNKSVSTQVSYANFRCTFDVKIEYYFVNTIAPITDLELDTDSDTLPDYLEVLYLTDLNNEDTDGDRLPDGVEVYRTYTDPLRVGTNNNGLNDCDEDYDKDKLTNIEEKNHGTDYDNVDTDFDSLSDYDEVNGVKSKDGTKTYILDPLSDDTDGDGLRDDTEIKLGLNPTNPSDAHTKVNQTINQSVLPKELTIESPTPISFKGEVIGDIDENVSAKLATDSYYDTVRGKIGLPIRVETSYGNDDGLKIVFDISKYSKKKDRIKIFRYDNGNLTMVERTYVSWNTIVGDVSSGEYVLIDTQVLLQEVNLFID